MGLTRTLMSAAGVCGISATYPQRHTLTAPALPAEDTTIRGALSESLFPGNVLFWGRYINDNCCKPSGTHPGLPVSI